MLRWPARAKVAIRKLFEPLQQIDVYVEDDNDEAFYRALLNSATRGQVRIARVFGLGGRSAVIAAACTHDHTVRRALFIVDGDLSWVRGECAPSIVSLHQHQAYCVENLLLCEQAISTVLSQEINITEPEAKRQLDYAGWCASIRNPLIELFAAFATVNEFDPTVKTVAGKVGNLCSNFELDIAKVEASKQGALNAAEKVAPKATVVARYRALLNRIKGLGDPLLSVSGKDFLLPLLQFRLSPHGCRIKTPSMRIRLASAGNVERFNELSQALILAAKGV